LKGANATFDELLHVLVGANAEEPAPRVPQNKNLEELTSMGFSRQLILSALEQSGPGADLQEVVEMLCGSQYEPSAASAPITSAPTASGDPWECPICFSEHDRKEWQCLQGHQFCLLCMRQHVSAVAFPRCPDVGCEYKLSEGDLRSMNVPEERIETFLNGQLQTAIDTLGTSNQSAANAEQEVLIRCQRDGCSNAMLIVLGDQPSRFECYCGAAAFCARCHQSPYHYHAKCSEVQQLRERWLAWVSSGRERQNRLFAAVANHEAQVRALREAAQRHKELEDDEVWKTLNCRICPGCRRPVQKLEGCDTMVCGEDTHGGNRQNGCGLRFNWRDARSYIKDIPVQRRSVPKITAKAIVIRGKETFHPSVHCDICSEPGAGLKGIRFRCVHCACFNVCSTCEPNVAASHEPSHVFDILYETDFDWSQVQLPLGTRVRLVRCGTSLPPQLLGKSSEGKIGTIQSMLQPWKRAMWSGEKPRYRVQLAGGLNQVLVPTTHVEPLISTQSDFVKLASNASTEKLWT